MALEVAGEPAHTRCLSVLLTKGQGDSIAFRADILDLRKAGLLAADTSYARGQVRLAEGRMKTSAGRVNPAAERSRGRLEDR